MAEIIDFDSIVVNSDSKKKLIEEFNKIEQKINTFIKDNGDDIDNKFKELYIRFMQFKKRANEELFLTDSQSERFLNTYKEICYDEDEFYECYRILEYINIVGLFKNRVLSKESSFIKILIDSIASYDDITIKDYNKVIPILLNKKIEELLKMQDPKIKKKDKMIDYIDQILNGYNLLEIYSYEIEKGNTDFDDLSAGIMTIDRIYNFYVYILEAINSIKENCIKNGNMIYKMILINSFSNESQLKFINIIKKIKKYNQGLVVQLKFICILVEIYLKLGKKIENYSEDNILTILSYSAINKIEVDESIDIVNKKL